MDKIESKSILISELYFKGRDEEIKNSISTFGNSLVLLNELDNLIFTFGKIDNEGYPIRITVRDKDLNRVGRAINTLMAVLKNHVDDFKFKEKENDFNIISDCKARNLDVVNILGFIPPVKDLRLITVDLLWMSKLFDRVSDMKIGYIMIVLRPFFKKNDSETSPIYNLLRKLYYGYDLITERIKTRSSNQENNGHRSGKQKLEDNREILQYNRDKINMLFGKNIDFLHDTLTSGAWWVSIWVVANEYAEVMRLASIYWSFVVKIGSIYNSTAYNNIYGRRYLYYRHYDSEEGWKILNNILNGKGKERGNKILETYKQRRRHEVDLRSLDYRHYDIEKLLKILNNISNGKGKERGNKMIGKERGNKILETYKQLRRHEVDLLYFIKKNNFKYDDDNKIKEEIQKNTLSEFLNAINTPNPSEIPITGNKIPSIFQFPAYPTSLINVRKGFNYCFKTPYIKKGIEIGYKSDSPLQKEVNNTRDDNSIYIDILELKKHMLIVGSTGSGKTNTIITLIRKIKENSKDTTIFVLEGAKREYRRYNLENLNFSIIDLVKKCIKLNIFAHPEFISFESHLSILGSIISSCFDLPTPLPALMNEALLNAYDDFHEEKDKIIKNGNPIMFFLTKAALKVANKAGYSGEIGSNIDAALRTRLRQLLTGIAGKVLNCNDSWKEMSKNLLGRDIIIELESIGDNRTRSFIMSLFALYFRYAVEEDFRKKKEGNEKLNRILILEEAHRIIGKSSTLSQQGMFNQSTGEHLEMFANMLSEIRAFNCGIIISDQSPSKLIPDSIRNTNTKLVMKLVSNDDIRAIIESSELPEEAAKDIPTLNTGQGILITGSGLPNLINIMKSEEPKRILYEKEDITFPVSNRKLTKLTLELIEFFKELKPDCSIDDYKKLYSRILELAEKFKVSKEFNDKVDSFKSDPDLTELKNSLSDVDTKSIESNFVNILKQNIDNLKELEEKLKPCFPNDDIVKQIIISIQCDLSAKKDKDEIVEEKIKLYKSKVGNKLNNEKIEKGLLKLLSLLYEMIERAQD